LDYVRHQKAIKKLISSHPIIEVIEALPPSIKCVSCTIGDKHTWQFGAEMLKSIEVTRGICHYKKSVFFVMLKKMQENVKKNRDDVHETSPKIRSTETCKKHGKNCTQHGQCLP
jgi:hypothetical protein